MTMCKWWARHLIVWTGLVLTATLNPGAGNAEYRGGTIKIGLLNDQSGLYADIAGTAFGLDGAQGGRGFRRRREGDRSSSAMSLRTKRGEVPVSTSLRLRHSLSTRLAFSRATPAIAARSAWLIFSSSNESRDHRRRPPEQARHRLEHCAPVV